jgi:uncharacterized protein YjbI with pentapeptide repeats
MSEIETVFRRLLAAAREQMTALVRASTGDASRVRALGACLGSTIERLDRAGVLIVVQVASDYDPALQQAVIAELDALHGHADPLLACIRPPGAIDVRRFAANLTTLDPLAPFRSGPEGVIDLSEKLITGVSRLDALAYLDPLGDERPGASEAVIANVALRGADLRMARLSSARLIDLDARGVNLAGALAIEAQLTRVNLAGAWMRRANLQAALARDCDFSGADLEGARWHGGTAVRCSFSGAEFIDLSADRAVFLDCDLQGVDLSVGALGAHVTMTGAQFLRCDLRWSCWENRVLAGVRFVGCKLHGVLGAPHFDGVVIDDPDLSPEGDGTQPGSLEEVLARWGARTGRRLASAALQEEAS